MVKGLEKFDWGWTITTDCPCPQGPTMIISIQKKKQKTGKAKFYGFYAIILLFKSIQAGRAQILFNLMRTYYVLSLRPESKMF